MSDTLLTLRDVHINFPARKNWLGKTTEHVHAINGIDLQIRRGETLGIVGGQRQRIAIARALSSQPDVIVLDEPTSALDISVQAQILNLLVTLQENHGLTYVLISHNVSVIRHMSDRVAVMYLGQIVELGEAQQVLTVPAHPYTRLLLDSLPAIDKPLEEEWALRKTDLPGNRTLPQGCFFYERCPLATHGCEVRQSLTIREDGREIRCWRAL
ncbi:oligopeptide/dipeptide ABC transporter ATP-binding protein [Escherichia coli]|uniref:oligopeptide/dipeptide ABC transporter ATP-binding protein n=1 Tax=Escherichia coli TaxID=562 RepID=UPI000446FAC2|nr:ABC transporter ATP-binding protein [Escherichia coli]EFX5951833.1 ABC transporter ATP-binding protein [Shigella sonnei]EEC7431642.1 ABC transporter ATP-binding protein [Escherichia coli]EEC7489561.1 ABC transporter ATP-binding protein [Escherichia coli]EEC9176433.1 ABC transporter ATP-binding protein [Escherichia coli]EEC9707290.1 ABC transporter ATP-binding protein [Escherichia coli]